MKTTLPSPLRPARWLGGGISVALAMLVGLARDLPAQSPPAPGVENAGIFSAADLEELLGPIALYPDALVALILPASTVPTEITLAARVVASGGNFAQIDAQTWDDSVKSLTRYPDVIQWMDENLAWTASVGDAFITQPTDVMNAMQRLREKARTAGHLSDTPQQTIVEEVVEESTYIRIVPTDPELLYVPFYDPQIVYYAPGPYYVGSAISFGVGFAIGSWLNYDCDWGRRGIYWGSYRRGWNQNWHNGNHRGGRNYSYGNSSSVNVVNITSASARRWNPGSGSRYRSERRNVGRRSQGFVTNVGAPIPINSRSQTSQGQQGLQGNGTSQRNQVTARNGSRRNGVDSSAGQSNRSSPRNVSTNLTTRRAASNTLSASSRNSRDSGTVRRTTTAAPKLLSAPALDTSKNISRSTSRTQASSAKRSQVLTPTKVSSGKGNQRSTQTSQSRTLRSSQPSGTTSQIKRQSSGNSLRRTSNAGATTRKNANFQTAGRTTTPVTRSANIGTGSRQTTSRGSFQNGSGRGRNR